MANKKSTRWDVKKGYGIYNSIPTETIKKWIKEGKVKKEEVFVWKSGMSGWRRPEELDEFKRMFKSRKRGKDK